MENNREVQNVNHLHKELTLATDWNALKEQAATLIKSGFMPPAINTVEKAIAVAMAGKELGIGLMESMRSINIIQGKPCISPQLMLALANRMGQLEDIEFDADDKRCVVTITRKGRKPHREEFGIKEASGLGLIGRDNYKKQPAIMFRWRALAAALRVTFPDLVLGLYTPEEMGAEVKTNSEGDMVVIDVNQDEWVNTGVRVPKDYWDLTTPEEKQERIGAGCKVQKTDKGWFIFTTKQSVDAFNAEMGKPKEEPK